MAAAVQEALYLKQLLEDFGIQQKRPIAIGEDNQSSIRLCQNPVMHKRSKHIETKFHFIRDKTEDVKPPSCPDKTENLHKFNSLRSYRQNGSGHLHKVLTRSESGNNQSSFDGKTLRNQLKSEWGVRNLIRVEDLKLVLLESLTYQINLTEVN